MKTGTGDSGLGTGSTLKEYGINNRKAYDAGECPATESTKHDWIYYCSPGRCRSEFHCICGARHVIDSSD